MSNGHLIESKKEPILFHKKILANTTDVLAERVKSDGMITSLIVRFYSGQEGSLQVSPFVEHKGNKVEYMVTFPNTSKTFISGDDDIFTFPLSLSVEYDDFIKVHVKNNSSYDYDLVCHVIVSYY